MPSGPLIAILLQLDVLCPWILWGLSTGGPHCKAAGQGYGMFTEGAPKVHICRAFPLGLTVSPERNPLIFYLVNITDFKLAVSILRSIREEWLERENLIFPKADISGSLYLKCAIYLRLSCACFPKSSLRLTQSTRTTKLNKFHEVLDRKARTFCTWI